MSCGLKHRPFAEVLSRVQRRGQAADVEVLMAHSATYVDAGRVSTETRDWIVKEGIVAADTEGRVARRVAPSAEQSPLSKAEKVDEGVVLYRRALAADMRFQAELVRAYGEAKAGEARYRRHHHDRGVARACTDKLAADKAWLEWLEGRRS